MELDMENRDPNDLNNHLKVCFDDVLGEPEGARSIEFIWKCSYKCFECGKNFCYKLLTTLCGICIAFLWGCDFSLTAFNHIWILTPCMRDFSICIGCVRKVVNIFIDCTCGPICEACGLCFSRIRITKG